MKHAVEMIVSGFLRNTGFRFYSQQKGIELGITGTIAYYGEEDDVFIHAEGDEKALEQFTDWCSKGLPYCKVHKIEVKAVPPLHYTGLNIMPAIQVIDEAPENETISKPKSLRMRIFGF